MGLLCGNVVDKGFLKSLSSLVKDISNIEDENEMAGAFIEQLKLLRSEYQDGDFFEAIDIALKGRGIRKNSVFKGVLSSLTNLKSLVDPKKDTTVLETISEDNSKVNLLDESRMEQIERESAKGAYLNVYFPLSSDARLAFEQRFKYAIIQNLFINKTGDLWTMNISNEEMDKSIKAFQKDLSDEVMDYISEFYPGMAEAYKSNLTLQQKINFLRKCFDLKSLTPLSRIDLIKFPNLENSSIKSKLSGYAAMISLMHFDELIQTSFGDAIGIRYNKNYIQDVLNNKLKYSLQLGNKNARTWRDDNKDINETNEIGSIIRLYIESLNVWNKDSVTLQRMTFQEVNTAHTILMQILNNPDLRDREIYYKGMNPQMEQGLKQLYGENSWEIIKSEFNTLGKLLAKAKSNPILFTPLLFAVIETHSNTYVKNNYQVKRTLHSLYKNIFDINNKNSLLNIALNSYDDNITANLYGFFNTLFINVENTPFMEYKENVGGGREVINITKNNDNRRLNNQVYALEGRFNVTIPLKSRSYVIDDFITDDSGDNIQWLNIGIGSSKIEDCQFFIRASGKSDGSVSVELITDNGEKVDLNKLTPELFRFLSEIFKFPINQEFIDIYTSLRSDSSISELFDVAGTILYNYKVGKVLNAKNTEDYNKVGKYYNGTVVTPARGLLQPELIPNSEYLKILTISQTKDLLLGFSGESTARDGEGKQISLKALSQLMSKYMELSINHNFTVDSIASQQDFQLYNLFKGVEFIRDYNGLNVKQQGIKFSTPEFYSGSFIYDLYDGISYQEESNNKTIIREVRPEDKKIEKTFIRIFGPVISDKNKLARILISPLDKVRVPGEADPIYVKDLTTEQIQKVRIQEFGNFYYKMHENIKKEFKKLNKILPTVIAQKYKTELPLGLTFNYDNDFQELNTYVKELNAKGIKVTSFQLLHDCIAFLQRKQLEDGETTYGVKIIDGVSYIKNKSGELHNNPALFHQLARYDKLDFDFEIDPSLKFSKESIIESSEKAYQRESLQLISEFITKDVDIYVDSSLDKANAILHKKAKDSGFLVGQNYIAYAKIMLGSDVQQSLLSKKDFQNWNGYKKLLKIFGNNIPEELNVNSPKFRLDKTLELINLVRTLRTLQYTEVKEVLFQNPLIKEYYLSQLVGTPQTIIENDLRQKNPTWGEEAIIRNAQKQLEGKSQEQIEAILLNFSLNNIIEQTIRAEYTGEPSRLNILTAQLTSSLVNPSEEISQRLSTSYQIEVNPEVARHNALNMWIQESYNLTSVGSFIAHPGNSNSKSIFNYEDSQVGQQIKRQVSQTASKHRELQNSLYGIGPILRYFVVEEDRDSYITYKGDYSKSGIKADDGATYYNMCMDILDNNSLGADAMGTTKKPFCHAYDSQTGTAVIIKTAGYVVNNQSIRDGQEPGKEGRDALMNRKMNDSIKWTQILKKYGINTPFFNYLQKYDGTKLSIDPQYYYDNVRKTWVKRDNYRIEPDGKTYYDETDIYDNGISKINGKRENQGGEIINSNYQLWKAFGGEWSGHFQDGKLIYEHDNSSTNTLVYVMNNAGIQNQNSMFKDCKIKTQENTVQVLKESMIHLWVTGGSIKSGATNINSTEAYYNSDYEITWMESNSSDLGEQLDSEHSAEGGHVALMTQVVNALGARGFSRKQARECYEALEAIVLQSFESGFDALQKYNDTNNSNELKAFVFNLLVKTLRNVSIKDGNILSALAQGLKKIDLSNLDDFDGHFAFSDPRIFNVLQSKIASCIEKAVRLKMEGGQYVLNPSNRRKKLIGNSLSGRVSITELRNLQEEAFKLKNDLVHSSQIKFGHSYYINKKELVDIDEYSDFQKVKDAILSGQKVSEAFLNNGVPITRDLATYECTFEDYEGNVYTIWDLDTVRELHSLKNNIFVNPKTIQEELWNRWQQNEILSDFELQQLYDWLSSLKVPMTVSENGFLIPDKQIDIKPYIKQQFQKDLGALKSGANSNVRIEGQIVVIDKSKTKSYPYEAILPMIYRQEFGLREGDEIDKIEKNPFFFVQRSLENRQGNIAPNYFDLELKVSTGKHIYLHYADGRPLPRRGIYKVNIETTVENGVLWRTENGKKLYPVPSKNGEADIEVFRYGDTEIISTSNLTEFLNQFKYDYILFGKVTENDLGNIVKQISQSTNETAQYVTKRIERIVKTRVTNHKEGLQNGAGENELKILVDSGLDTQLEAIEDPESMDINFITETPVTINELFNSDMIKKGQDSYERGINELLLLLERRNDPTYNFDLEQKRLMEEYPFLSRLVEKGIKKHTSFLTSLESIVSRTPAQSHQSFMTMKIVGFDQNLNNSIYVSRMQIFLQGSDFDIDKANVLGLKFLNGELITWSPFYDLSSKETAEISEEFPFPTGKVVEQSQMVGRAINIIDDYEILTSKEQQEQQIIVQNTINNNTLSATKNNKGEWIIIGDVDYTTSRVLFSKLPKNAKLILSDIPQLNRKALGITTNIIDEEKGIYEYINTQSYDLVEDFKDYLSELKDQNGDYSLDGKVKLIRMANELQFIDPSFEKEIGIIDKHNLYLKNKPYLIQGALHNFISIKTKNISKDPINLIQGQSGIDEATDEYKDSVNPDKKEDRLKENKRTFDRLSANPITSGPFTILAQMEKIILTLSGKQNTGIVASAMKTFEAMSQYYYDILAQGTESQQLALLSSISINGKEFQLLANSFVKNEDKIKSDKVLKALQQVNNIEDAFILMSALLSLSTDNAKDPTLSKYNAGPEMIGLYTAGIILGVDRDTLCDLIISDTGILLRNLQKGNVFDPNKKKFNRLSKAISYLTNPPRFNFHNLGDGAQKYIRDLAKNFGIPLESSEKITSEDLQKALRNPRGRRKMRRLASFILRPNESKIKRTDERLIKNNIDDIKDDERYYKWKNPDGKKRQALQKLKEKESLTKSQKEKLEKLQAEEQEYNSLVVLLKGYQSLLRGEESVEANTARKDLEKQKTLQEKLIKDDNVLKDLRKLAYNDEDLKNYLQDVFEWTDHWEVISKDKIVGEDGNSRKRLYEIQKLNQVNEEMGELRKVLALNQGLPNLVQDQINWVRGFQSILANAVKRANVAEDDESLSALVALNQKLREEGKIFFENDLYIDLNSFLNNSDYQQAVVNAYQRCKRFVNIMDVMLHVPHYRGYLKAMNLLVEGLKSASVTYKEQFRITDWILPKLNLIDSNKIAQFQKSVTPIIFKKLNQEFLMSQQEIYRIPVFTIKDGELIEEFNEDGSLKYRNIKLGTDESNKIFCDWVVNYLYPYLESNYSDNAFVKATTLRSYKYNSDHNITVNIAKLQSYNMENAQENVAFNEIKQGLHELNSITLKLEDGTEKSAGIVTALFYYNLIAYNGQPGTQSLTDLFEDIIVYDENQNIAKYTEYLRERDKSGKVIFSEKDEGTLIRLLAPVVSGYEQINIYPYSYLVNPETNKYELVKPKIDKTPNYEDDPGISDIESEIIAQEIEQEYGFADDLEGFGKVRKGMSWKDLKDLLKVEGANENISTDTNGNIIFNGYEIKSDITKFIEISNEDPIEILKNNAGKILLEIKGEQQTLTQFFEKAKNNGWSEKECWDIFQIQPKKRADGLIYNVIDMDILRSGLKTRNTQKPTDCNG